MTIKLPKTFARLTSYVALMVLGLAVVAGCSDAETDPVETSIFEPQTFGEYVFEASPEISATERLDFGDVAMGRTVYRVLEVSNLGREVLEISDWEIPQGFELESAQGPVGRVSIEPGETRRFNVAYTSPDEEAVDTELVISSNDPGTPKWPVRLLANVQYPCLLVAPAEIDFGFIDLDETVVRSVRIRNCSPNADTTYEITDIDGSGSFTLEDEAMGPRTLAPGQADVVEVRFRPTRSGAHSATVRITTDDVDERRKRVELTGRAAQEPCPVAAIEARATNRQTTYARPTGTFQGVPLDSVTLDARGSRGADANIEKYEWTLVSKPTDSGAVFTNTEQEMLRRLWLDLAGEYVVELNVVDTQGRSSCSVARMTLISRADQDIHLQLVWDTPSDPDQTDSSGSDVDLHLLHPLGEWNLRPYDCFWQNMEPDWGEPRSILPDGTRVGYDDDPSLDIDDTDGKGPENINLDNPEPVTYGVGVHYFSDHGYSLSYATVRIYIGGILFEEYVGRRISDGDFWYVADIEWPGGVIDTVDLVYPTFPRE